MKRLVRVVVDGKERTLAAGLTVRHVLSPGQLEQALAGKLVVVDGRGRERGLGGALLDGAVLSIQPRPARA